MYWFSDISICEPISLRKKTQPAHIPYQCTQNMHLYIGDSIATRKKVFGMFPLIVLNGYWCAAQSDTKHTNKLN